MRGVWLLVGRRRGRYVGWLTGFCGFVLGARGGCTDSLGAAFDDDDEFCSRKDCFDQLLGLSGLRGGFTR